MEEKKSWLESDNLSEKEKATLFVEEAKVIQGVINRMATNSFLVKGWTITLIVGVLVLKPEGRQYLLASLLPLFGFWWLDAFFLRQERLFRQLYNHQIVKRTISFDGLFSLDTCPFLRSVPGVFNTMFSPTLLTFYLIILLLIVIGYFITFPVTIPIYWRCC